MEHSGQGHAVHSPHAPDVRQGGPRFPLGAPGVRSVPAAACRRNLPRRAHQSAVARPAGGPEQHSYAQTGMRDSRPFAMAGTWQRSLLPGETVVAYLPGPHRHSRTTSSREGETGAPKSARRSSRTRPPDLRALPSGPATIRPPGRLGCAQDQGRAALVFGRASDRGREHRRLRPKGPLLRRHVPGAGALTGTVCCNIARSGTSMVIVYKGTSDGVGT